MLYNLYTVDTNYWQKQTKQAPLFEALLWSRPENRLHAGKLLIIGGSGYEFKAPANAYGDALNSGIGVAKVILPDSMKKVVADIFPEADYAPTTPSGSFSRLSLTQLLDTAEWADGVLLAGNFGRNSETAIVLEDFLSKFKGKVTVTHDAVDFFVANASPLLDRAGTTLVLSFGQLQKLATNSGFATAFTSSMDLLRFIEIFHDFSRSHPCNIIVKFGSNLFVGKKGKVSSTPVDADKKIWRVETATAASVWWIQNPSNTFKALTTSIIT
jgi:ADP-dependent NAD(P)H-hydrate dehydratase / NAD(P)H-hydrate epimerase